MKSNTAISLRLIIITCTVGFIASGCAVSRSRLTEKYREIPHYYPSTKMVFEGKHLDGLGPGDPIGNAICICLVCPVTFPIEFPLSIATDTILLPVDFWKRRDSIKSIRFISKALYSEKTPKATEFMKRYKAKLCESDTRSSVRHYLNQPPEQIKPDKVTMLLDTGAFDSMLVKGNYIDMHLLDVFLVKTRAGQNMQYIFALATNPHLHQAGFGAIVERALQSGEQRWPILANLLMNPSTPVPILDRICDALPPVNLHIQEAIRRIKKHPNATQAIIDKANSMDVIIPQRIDTIHKALYTTYTPIPQDFMQHYNADTCESDARSSVRRFLSVRNPQAAPFMCEKVLMLLGTGTFDPMIASGVYLDMDIVEALMNRAADNEGLLIALGSNVNLPDEAFELIIAKSAKTNIEWPLLETLLHNRKCPPEALLQIGQFEKASSSQAAILAQGLLLHPRASQAVISKAFHIAEQNQLLTNPVLMTPTGYSLFIATPDTPAHVIKSLFESTFNTERPLYKRSFDLYIAHPNTPSDVLEKIYTVLDRNDVNYARRRNAIRTHPNMKREQP